MTRDNDDIDNDVIVEKVINIYQNWCNQTL